MAGSPSTTCWTPSLRWEKGKALTPSLLIQFFLLFLSLLSAEGKIRVNSFRERPRGSTVGLPTAKEKGEIRNGGVSVKS